MKTKTTVLIAITFIGTLVSCKSTFNATETLRVEENRNAIYQEIISNPVQFTNFISEARKNEEAKKILMKGHMEQMESENMKMMMEKNPDMKEKMQSHMKKMMDKNPEMMQKMQKMQSKMLEKMMENEKGRKMLMEKIHNNEMMKKEMKKRMKKMMDENPDMMEKMMQKKKKKMEDKK
ncbi:hypothetical protein ACJRPK_03865 [Aquimarina sp. 2-A2]|uniref:hypothetical protein n=1 Tax=Aquimarina sp. 2-A2 TaxID=3382644 RepID=UPI00387F2C07